MPGFQYEPYQSPYAGTIAEILGRAPQAQAVLAGSDARARAAEIKGQNTRSLFGSLGQIAQGAGQQIGGYLADAPRREMEQISLRAGRSQEAAAQAEGQAEANLRKLLATTTNPSVQDLAATGIGPARAMTLAKDFAALETADEARMLTSLNRRVNWIKALPPGMRAEPWGQTRQELVTAGLPAQMVPEQWDDQMGDALLAYTGEKSKTPEPFTLSEGQTRFDPSGKPMANVPKPVPVEKPPEVGTFGDYLVTYARDVANKPLAALTAADKEDARKRFQQADDRPFRPIVPIVVQTAAGPQIVDRTSGTAKPITDTGGQTVGLVPTADQRNRDVSVQRAQPVLNSIAELSERINTQQGVIAKISGAAERAKAQANLSDDVSEYQALVSMFTPILARMVGHTGVLTEQDVQSVRAGLPAPGDSKSVRDRKMARIRTILGGQTASHATPSAPPSSAFSVTAPNGKVYTFKTQKDLDAFKQRAGIQ